MAEQFPYFSRNGIILPIKEAQVPLADLEYAYGYGVYETIRVANGTVYFLDEHCDRLLASADILGLEHPFDRKVIAASVRELVTQNDVTACNVKLLLIGGRTAADATLYIQCLRPLFPDRRLYREGVHTITINYERLYPHAKSLNMLPSYLAYRDAQRAGAYDALLINSDSCITEGTRTNFFALRERTLYSPPANDILLGVTRSHVLQVAREQQFTIKEQPLPLADITKYEAVFLTSTSSKIMPIASIDEHRWAKRPAALTELMQSFSNFLETKR